MSHNIESFAFTGKPAWHNLGKRVSNDMTAEEMLVEADLNWTTSLHPTFAEINGKKVQGLNILVRDSDQRVLTHVPRNWVPMQNADAFEFFKEFVDAGSMTMECAGSLKGGQLVFALAKIDETIEVIKGDPTHQYMLLTNPNVYGSSINTCMTAIRTVCWNTVQMALSSSTVGVEDEEGNTYDTRVKSNHRKQFNAEKVKKTLGLASSKFQKYGEMLKFLTEKRADATQIEFYLKEVFPQHSGKDQLSRTAETVLANMDTQPGVEFGQGTWYSVFQGVTFTTDNVLGRSEDTRVRSAWYGINAARKQLALKKAIAYAQAA